MSINGSNTLHFLLSPQRISAVIVLLCVGAFAAAFTAEYVFGLLPCVLCIYQRYAYAAALAAGLAGLAVARNRSLHRLSLLAAGASFLMGSAIAGFHVGVEFKWWRGTDGCHAPELDPSLSIDEMKALLLDQPFVACDEIPWELFGISIAGYNFLAMLLFGLFSMWAFKAPLHGGEQ
ncbi:MAG: disulfide bond formation protein B [Kiloniellales bacterium]|nr:disulfide bond formation protein B [Kiloniellales bacterium]